MKTCGFLASRPWLLVWVAFLLVIAAWVVTYRLAMRVPTERLTPGEEAALLQRGKMK